MHSHKSQYNLFLKVSEFYISHFLKNFLPSYHISIQDYLSDCWVLLGLNVFQFCLPLLTTLPYTGSPEKAANIDTTQSNGTLKRFLCKVQK